MASTVVGMEALTVSGRVLIGSGASSAEDSASPDRTEKNAGDQSTSTESSLVRLCRWFYPISDGDEFIRTSLLWEALAAAR